MPPRKKQYTLLPGRLWPNTPSGAPLDIEVFGATGDYESGKTILGGSIAPGAHPKEHQFAGEPRTLYLDFEKSGGTYGGIGWHRVDVAAKMRERFLDQQSGKVKKYGTLDIFVWFLEVIEKLTPGRFDVIHCDPITDIESGLVEYVKKHHDDFGLSAAQIQKAGGLLWGAVKDYWKQVLLKLSTRCQCFYFTSHLRLVWHGNTPTNRREPKGKDTLMELASLYLWLERKPDKDGKMPKPPAAMVMKQRLSDTILLESGELKVTPLLPPRLPVAMVETIRSYIANPQPYDKLHDNEKVIEQKMTNDERLQLELAKAEAERDTEETRLVRQGRMIELQQLAQQREAAKPQSPDQTAARQQAKAEKRQADAEAAKADSGPAPDPSPASGESPQTAEDRELTETTAAAKEGVEKAQAETDRLMTDHESTEFPPKQEPATSQQSAEQPAEQPAEQAATEAPEKANAEQVARLQQVCQVLMELKANREKLAEFIKARVHKAEAKSLRDLTFVQIEDLIVELDTMRSKKATQSQEATSSSNGT